MGIEYHTVFRKDVLYWSQIDQLDYSPSTGRIAIYLRDRVLPILFGSRDVTTIADPQESSLIRLLKENIESCGGIVVQGLSI